MKFAAHIILIPVFLLFCLSCKKYPENNLWFKNPNRIPVFVGALSEYRVNGIDSLELLNVFIADKPGLNKNIHECKFTTSEDKYNHQGRYSAFLVPGRGNLPLRYSFVDNKKYITIGFAGDTSIFSKDIFIDSNIKWKIVRLKKNGHFKIETTLSNGNKYEISID